MPVWLGEFAVCSHAHRGLDKRSTLGKLMAQEFHTNNQNIIVDPRNMLWYLPEASVMNLTTYSELSKPNARVASSRPNWSPRKFPTK